MSDENTTKKTPKTPQNDWSWLNSITEEACPLSPDDMRSMRRTPQVRIIRRALKLSQEEFAERFQIPLGTLRDWERGRKEPDAAARAYLMVIGRNPAAVTEALHPAA